MSFINLDLLKNPLNWVIVLLMLVIFAMFADLVLRHYTDILATLGQAKAQQNS